MILPPTAVRMLCWKEWLSVEEARIILYNYIYYKTGTKEKSYSDGKMVDEIANAQITNIPNFERCLTIACNYFI